MSKYGVVLFHTTSAAIRSEKVLKKAGIAVRLIPVPRELSSDCGISARFPWDQVERVREALARETVENAGLHELTPG